MENLIPDLRPMPAVNLIFCTGVRRFGKRDENLHPIYVQTLYIMVHLSQNANDALSLVIYRPYIDNLTENW